MPEAHPNEEVSVSWQWRFRDALVRNARGRPLYFFAAPGLAVYLLGTFLSQTSAQGSALLLESAGLVLLLWIVQLTLIWYRGRRVWGEAITATASREAISVAAGGAVTTVPWDGLIAADVKRSGLTLRWQRAGNSLAIPRRAFRNQTQLDALLAFARPGDPSRDID